jgi:hypothetical protein
LDAGTTRRKWLESLTSKELQELRILANEEPIGSDAILIQLAIVAKAMAGGKLEDLLVLSSKHRQSAEQMADILKPFTGN